MTLEKGPSNNQNPLELLKRKNYIVADTFIVRIDDSSDKEAEEKVRTSLSAQGVTDPVTIIFCKSPEEQIREIIKSLKNQKASSASHDPWMYIVSFDADQLQKMFETLSTMIIEKNEILEDIDGKNITILQLNAKHHMDSTGDARTGLKIAAIKKGELSFLTHPTPTH